MKPSAPVTSPEDSVMAPVRVLNELTPAVMVTSPEPSSDVPLMVLMVVPDTRIGWYVLAAEAEVRYPDSDELVR